MGGGARLPAFILSLLSADKHQLQAEGFKAERVKAAAKAAIKKNKSKIHENLDKMKLKNTQQSVLLYILTE